MLHIPLLRRGEPYRSLDVVRLAHHRTGEPFAEVSQANAGLIRRDLREQSEGREALAKFTVEELLEICSRAAEHFLHGELPLGDTAQTPDDYVRQVSATTGLPHALARRNMQKVYGVMAEMREVLRGLTRGLDLSVLDRGYGEHDGRPLSFYPRTDSLGVVLPSNSPGVHTLWIPAVPLKIPLALKPGGAEPWTPYRVAQSFIRAGAPPLAFGYYPTDHAGAAEILRATGRGMAFGDVSSVGQWKSDPRVEVHGPGYSKVVIGDDCADEWERYVDIIAASVADNGGRSCINASGVWATRRAEEIAEALAEKLARVVPRDAEDSEAQLAPFADPRVAAAINASIEDGLRVPGARDVTAPYRKGARLVTHAGCTYLLPTVVLCESPEHPLANREFLFPYASVVPVSQEDIPRVLGPSLVVTAVTRDPELVGRLVSSPLVDRLNVGPLPTNQIGWDQPHEGNLFEHLYARRAFQTAAGGQ